MHVVSETRVLELPESEHEDFKCSLASQLDNVRLHLRSQDLLERHIYTKESEQHAMAPDTQTTLKARCALKPLSALQTPTNPDALLWS